MATTVDHTTARLRSAILSGSLRPGQRLAPERELAEELGVHRGTLRTALHRLVASGLIAQRQGRGTTVRDFRRAGGPSLLPGLAELAESEGRLAEVAGDLLLVRLHLARAVLERIVEVQPDASGCVAAVDAFSVAVARGARLDELAQADVEIVAALLAATGSPVLQLCLNPVMTVLARVPALHPALYRRPEDNVLAYRALLSWLAAPSSEGVAPILALLAERDRETVRLLENR